MLKGNGFMTFLVQAMDSRSKKRVVLFPWLYELATLFLAFDNNNKRLICCLWICVLFLAVNVIHCLSQGLESFTPKIPAISCVNCTGINIS